MGWIFGALECLTSCYAWIMHLIIDFTASHPFISILVLPIGLIFLVDYINDSLSGPHIPDVQGKYVLVTGCAKGFGRDLVLRLDALGCHVFAACRSENGMTELDKETSERVEVIKMDISNAEEVRKVYHDIKSKIPAGKGLWGLVNNAAIPGSMNGPTDWLPTDAFREVLNVNLLGAIDVTMTFLPLIKQARGRVVNVSSTYGRVNLNFAGHYGVAKFGLEGFSDSLRQCLKPFKCNVVVVEPGLVRTNIGTESSVAEALSRTWNNLSQEVKDEYGHDYVDRLNTAYAKGLKFTFGNTVSTMSKAMEQALFCKNPRARIMAGNDNKFVHRFIIKMPEWMQDWFLDHLTGFPHPACEKTR